MNRRDLGYFGLAIFLLLLVFYSFYSCISIMCFVIDGCDLPQPHWWDYIFATLFVGMGLFIKIHSERMYQ